MLVAQPDPALMSAKTVNNGWKLPNGTWLDNSCTTKCCKYKDRTNFQPCLFNITADPDEHDDLSDANTELVQDMWTELNTTLLTSYTARTPKKLLGPCNRECANKVWDKYGGPPGPICDVPGCK